MTSKEQRSSLYAFNVLCAVCYYSITRYSKVVDLKKAKERRTQQTCKILRCGQEAPVPSFDWVILEIFFREEKKSRWWWQKGMKVSCSMHAPERHGMDDDGDRFVQVERDCRTRLYFIPGSISLRTDLQKLQEKERRGKQKLVLSWAFDLDKWHTENNSSGSVSPNWSPGYLHLEDPQAHREDQSDKARILFLFSHFKLIENKFIGQDMKWITYGATEKKT